MDRRDRNAIDLGMNYRITFENGTPDVYVASLSAIGPAVRALSPDHRFVVTDLRAARVTIDA